MNGKIKLSFLYINLLWQFKLVLVFRLKKKLPVFRLTFLKKKQSRFDNFYKGYTGKEFDFNGVCSIDGNTHFRVC